MKNIIETIALGIIVVMIYVGMLFMCFIEPLSKTDKQIEHNQQQRDELIKELMKQDEQLTDWDYSPEYVGFKMSLYLYYIFLSGDF